MKNRKICTACGACKNICPKNAIQMKEDSKGFLYPSIDEKKCVNCHQCEKVCKNIRTILKNFPSQTLALQSKNNTLSERSSSGGLFAQIAKYVLEKNGIVFGCTIEKINNEFNVKHIYIDNENDLYKLQGSKYVQSNVQNTYREVQNLIKQNKFVLFSLIHCQIGGLKAYLQNKDYNNLLTIDVNCTGTPSLKLFNDYVNFLENKFKKKIINFEFRNKIKMGWCCGKALITFENKKQKLIYNSSSYLNLFINGGIHRKSCYNCFFTGLDRIADITLADCWGIELEYPNLLKQNRGTLDKDKGISLVLINTSKGEEILGNIKEKLIIENIDITKLKKYNGPFKAPIKLNEINKNYLSVYEKFGYNAMDKLFKKNLGWKYFYYKIKERTPIFVKNIIRLFIKKTNNKVDCLLLTWFAGANYGSILTAYALKESIKKLGLSVKYINNGVSIGYSKKFNKKYAEVTDLCLVNKDFENLNKLSNTFIVGADNQLDFNCVKERIYQNLLDFTNSSSKKMIISGSFGSWDWEEKLEVMQNLKLLFQRFDFISTREDISKQKLKEKFNIDAEWFMDPVFFLEKQDYENLINNTQTNDYKNSIMRYILYPNKDTTNTIKYIQKKYNLNVNYFYGNEFAMNIKNSTNMSVENWLKSIRDAKFIVTDSFHCVAFAIIFNRPVICLKNKCDTTRFFSIFNKLNISIPIYSSYQNFLDNINEQYNIDYEKINNFLKIYRKQILTQIKEEFDREKLPKQEVEKIFLEKKKEYYHLHKTPIYKKNTFLYKYFVYPFFINIIIKYRKKKLNKNE